MNDIAYTTELMGIFKSVPDDKKSDFLARFTSQAKNPTAIFGFAVYLGLYGVDRFLLGNIGLGVLKLFTLGGLGVWYTIDLFTAAGRARQKNIELARQIASY
jgi:TM2 domain-containing membrane protein YozV